jgi:hypothetical protein
LLHAVDILCINYYEAFQRKKRANSWNDCHSRIECLDSKSAIKICWNFVRAISNTSVWLQAGKYLALAAQIPAKQKSGCRPLLLGVGAGTGSSSSSQQAPIAANLCRTACRLFIAYRNT